MKKNKLDFDYSPLDEYQLIGISSPLPAYKLCWFLNKKLLISLQRSDDYDITHKQGRFSYPFYKSKWNQANFFLIQNHGQPIPMNKQFKIFDYFIILNDLDQSQEIDFLINEIATIPKVQLIQSIELKKVIEKENFIIEDF